MKKSVRILAVAMALLMVTFVFASCGKTIKGSYSAEVDVIALKYTATYEFSGKNVTVTKVVNPLIGESKTYTIEGTYEIIENDDDTMDIKFTFETEDEHIKSGTLDFEQGEDYIKIGVVKYTKK
ncbi:MAG: hypothetical protein IKU90_06825 [Clostridia bacterium]|nr:hypothetical protein [Clostridia bacterium]